jgi:hypothetical protein
MNARERAARALSIPKWGDYVSRTTVRCLEDEGLAVVDRDQLGRVLRHSRKQTRDTRLALAEERRQRCETCEHNGASRGSPVVCYAGYNPAKSCIAWSHGCGA